MDLDFLGRGKRVHEDRPFCDVFPTTIYVAFAADSTLQGCVDNTDDYIAPRNSHRRLHVGFNYLGLFDK